MNKRYQIFISSTFSDLKDIRKSLFECLMHRPYIPFGMEMFGATAMKKWENIMHSIDESDCFVLILGFKYGSLTNKGIGYVESEYLYALEQNKPMLVFIRHEESSSKFYERETNPGNIELLKRFRSKLEKVHQFEFWMDSVDLNTKVLSSLPNCIFRSCWVRDEHNNCKQLSDENSFLRKEIEVLKEEYVNKTPDIRVRINDQDCLQIPYGFYGDFLKVERLKHGDIPDELKQAISDAEINEYNSRLPTNEMIEKYNHEKEIYWRVKNTNQAIHISISNQGCCKANSIHIKMIFPDNVDIVKKNFIDHVKKPPKLELPINPIDKWIAAANADRAFSLQEILRNLYGNSNLLEKYGITRTFQIPHIPPVDPFIFDTTLKHSIEKNVLNIELNEMLHTCSRTIDGIYYLIPWKIEKNKVKVEVICEEFSKKVITQIPIEVYKTN